MITTTEVSEVTATNPASQASSLKLGSGPIRWRLEFAVVVPGAARLLLVQARDDRLRDFLDGFLGRMQRLRRSLVALLQPVQLLLDHLQDLPLVVVRNFAAELLLVVELPLQRVGELLQLVLGLDLLLDQPVLFSELLGLLDESVDVVRVEPVVVVGDGDLVLLLRSPVLGGDLHHAVGVDLEGDLDLRDSSGGRWDPVQVKGPEQVVVFGHRALALVHLER